MDDYRKRRAESVIIIGIDVTRGRRRRWRRENGFNSGKIGARSGRPTETVRGTRGAHKARDPAVDDAVLERCAGRQYPQRCPVGEDVCRVRACEFESFSSVFRKRVFK